MHHSSWDLEVHARQMQECRLREADRARQIDAARRGNIRHRPSWFGISRFVTLAQAWLSPRRAHEGGMDFGAESQAHSAVALLPTPVKEPRLKPVARSIQLSRPYADMAVLARGTVAPAVEQLRGVGDC